MTLETAEDGPGGDPPPLATVGGLVQAGGVDHWLQRVLDHLLGERARRVMRACGGLRGCLYDDRTAGGDDHGSVTQVAADDPDHRLQPGPQHLVAGAGQQCPFGVLNVGRIPLGLWSVRLGSAACRPAANA
jgi:hypothetical protein